MSRRELAEALEVDIRQVSRYKEDLCMAGIHIKEERGRYGGYSIDEGFNSISANLNEDEVLALELGVNCLATKVSFPFKEDLSSGILKVLASYENCESNFWENCATVQYRRISRYRTDLKYKWKIVNNSILHKKKLKIKYSNIYDEERVRVVHPYGIYIYEGANYMVAYCEYKKAVRNFKLVRISELKELDDTFENDSFNLKSYLNNRIGIYSDRDIYNVKLKIYYPYAKCFKEHRWVEKEQFENHEEKGYLIYKGKIEGKTDIIRWVLEMGSFCEVLEPKEIKDAIIDECNKVIELYNI